MHTVVRMRLLLLQYISRRVIVACPTKHHYAGRIHGRTNNEQQLASCCLCSFFFSTISLLLSLVWWVIAVRSIVLVIVIVIVIVIAIHHHHWRWKLPLSLSFFFFSCDEGADEEREWERKKRIGRGGGTVPTMLLLYILSYYSSVVTAWGTRRRCRRRRDSSSYLFSLSLFFRTTAVFSPSSSFIHSSTNNVPPLSYLPYKSIIRHIAVKSSVASLVASSVSSRSETTPPCSQLSVVAWRGVMVVVLWREAGGGGVGGVEYSSYPKTIAVDTTEEGVLCTPRKE